MTIIDPDSQARTASAFAEKLLTPEAVRERAHHFLDLARNDALSCFSLREDNLSDASDHVIRLLNARFPGENVPFHARWRHFEVAETDRAAALLGAIPDKHEKARARFDLAITSVLLDAGAGEHWTYRDLNNQVFARSEGLAIASLEMFAAGFFSSSQNPLQADAEKLANLSPTNLATGFQVSRQNPMIGLEGRAALLAALGHRILSAPACFPGPVPRPGNLYDLLLGRAENSQIAARDILISLLDALGPIWPDRLTLGGLHLGDTWQHRLAKGDNLPDGYIPFHKLSQWLAYSLIEPLQEAGISVTDINGLTGLAEYRNGGLFVDHGIICPKSTSILTEMHNPDSEVIIEWRALTIALLDHLAADVRQKLALDENQLPLASILEAGTWAAGREIALAKRGDGSPPIAIAGDGTVF